MDFPGPGIGVKRNAFPLAKEMIEALEGPDHSSLWTPGAYEGKTDSDYRKCHEIEISQLMWKGRSDLKPIDDAFFMAFNGAVKDYLEEFKFLHIERDEGYSVVRYRTSEYLNEHVDGYDYSLRKLAGLLYLNDGYEGGELNFPIQGLKIKPEAGMVVLFPSCYAYPHSVSPVTSGTRYSVLTWFGGRIKVRPE